MYHNETIKNIIIKCIPAVRRRKQILFDEYNHSWREQNLFMTHIKKENLLINVGFFFRFKQLKTVCSTKQTIQPYTPISTFYKSEENVAGFFIACTDAADGIKVCLSFLMSYINELLMWFIHVFACKVVLNMAPLSSDLCQKFIF